MANLDWSRCPAVESIPGKVSGAWVFRDTRLPVATVIENLEDLSVEEVMEQFDVTREQIAAVLEFVAQSLKEPVPGQASEPAVAGPSFPKPTDQLTRIRRLAEEGDSEAQFDLGYVYEEGDGVPQDDAEAARWYRKAAEQGNADAQFNLGYMHREGRGVPQDFVEAARCYRRWCRSWGTPAPGPDSATGTP
jgi:TPR repeat protein